MVKGISVFLSAVILVSITIVIAIMISGWVSMLSREQASKLKNITEEKLKCQYASLYIRNVSYDCNSTCFTGAPYMINATIDNTGTIELSVSEIVTVLNTGQIYRSYNSTQAINPGDIVKTSFNTILLRITPTTFTYNVTYPNIDTIEIYDSSNTLIDSLGPLSGANRSIEESITNTSTAYRIEVEDTNGDKITKYYPFVPGKACLDTSSLDRVTITSSSCPYTGIDSFYGSDVTFVNCI